MEEPLENELPSTLSSSDSSVLESTPNGLQWSSSVSVRNKQDPPSLHNHSSQRSGIFFPSKYQSSAASDICSSGTDIGVSRTVTLAAGRDCNARARATASTAPIATPNPLNFSNLKKYSAITCSSPGKVFCVTVVFRFLYGLKPLQKLGFHACIQVGLCTWQLAWQQLRSVPTDFVP